MINNYYIRNVDGKEVLYLNFDFSYEFSRFDFKVKKEKIEEAVRNFIKNNRISFKGGTILLVSSGILFGSVTLNTPNFSGSSINSIKPIESSVVDNSINESIILDNGDNVILSDVKADTPENSKFKTNENVEQTKPERVLKENVALEEEQQVNQVSTSKAEEKIEVITPEIDNSIYVNVRRNGSVIKIELEEYVLGVVGAEMPASFNIEALKAQAVIARTYALNANSRGVILSDNESSQSYKSNEELRSLWGGSFDIYYNKIKSAVNGTSGMYLSYNGSYIEAVYHSTSNGKTEDSINVWGNFFPYLVSVDSPYDNSNPSFLKTSSFSYSDISSKLGVIVTSETDFIINGKTSGNRVTSITVGEVTFSGVQFRNKLGLRSADFDIEKSDEGVVITTRGYGHGVGMSQYGANGMAKAGSSYRDILFHYYPGVSLKSL